MIRNIAFVCLVLYLSTVLAQNECQKKRLHDVKTLAQKVRGVNLGSWIVMEGWMAASVWDSNGCNKDAIQGSYMLEKCLGDRAQAVLQHHWDTFITEKDFEEMSAHGLNLIRLPVGWWQIYDKDGGVRKVTLNQTIDPKDYIAVGALHVIDKAFAWAEKYGMAVLLDMHAAPGSQNGFDNSSPWKNGEVDWHKYPANVNQTIDSMELFAARYAKHPALFGFQLLNEPARTDRHVVQSYYERAYPRVRAHSPDSWIVIMAPIIPGESGTEAWWINFMNPPSYTKVAMDLHYYSCFGGPPDQHNPEAALHYVNGALKAQIAHYAQVNPHKPMLIGEWSACAHIAVDRIGDFMHAEVEVFNNATMGHTFWSWTTGSGDQWSLKSAFAHGWTGDFFKC